MLETVEYISTVADVIVLVLLVGNVLDKHRGVEVYQRAGEALATIFREVDGGEGAIGTVTLTHHRCTTPATTVRIEVIGLLAGSPVFYFDKVRGIHGVPLSINEPGKDGAFVTPLTQILNGS